MPKEQSIWQAARSGDSSRIKEYVDKGGSISEPDPQGMTLLHHACYGNGDDNNRQCVNILCNHSKVELEAQDTDNLTALHCAASAGNLAAVEELLEVGANFNARDGARRTPLHITVTCGKPAATTVKIIKTLLENGCGLNIKANTGKTAKDVAEINMVAPEIVEALSGGRTTKTEAEEAETKTSTTTTNSASAAAAASSSTEEKKE